MRRVLAAALLATCSAYGIVVSGNDINTYTVAGGALGGVYDGVAEIVITRSDGAFGCSGTLLPTGRHVLTAAHCLTNATGALITTNSTVFFDFGSGTQTLSGSAYFVSPDYNPVVVAADIAIIALSGTAALQIPRYDFYRGNSEGLQTALLMGYGIGGYGTTGADSSTYPFGTRRGGYNRIDAYYNTGAMLGYDFDDGTTAHDAFGVVFGFPNLGLGTAEVNTAGGDSGGPSFIGCPLNCQIVGVHSLGIRYAGSDIDGTLNSSFGEVMLDTRVSQNQAFIDSVLMPEPGTYLLTLAGVLVLIRRRPRKE